MAASSTSAPAPAPGTGPAVRNAVVIGGNRIPFARSGGAYAHSSNQDMLTAALDGLVARFGLQDERIGTVAAGAVLKHSRDFNLTREAVLGSALSPETPAYDVQQACATGLETVVSLANKIKLGQLDSAIAGGVDSASDAPIAVSEGLRRALLDLSRAKTTKQKLAAIAKIRPRDLAPNAPTTGEPRTGLSMGEHQALTTAQWKITRESQDELAYNSHRNLAAAYDRGILRRPDHSLPRPVPGLEPPRGHFPGEAGKAQACLRPVPGRRSHHDGRQLHAADRRSIRGPARFRGLRPGNTTCRCWRTSSTPKPVRLTSSTGADGLLMAPAFAVPRLLARNNLTFADFDFFEIHEAFAGTVLSTLAAWEDDEFCRTRLGLDAPLGSIDRSKLNVNGSSLAAGHPFAATGGRIVASLAKMLAEKGSGRGLISICAAGGQGLVAILEAR